MAAAVGPPPGLGGASRAPPPARSSPGVFQVIARSTEPYSRQALLALSRSPLVAPPADMPALKAWYGDWEPYTPRPIGGGAHMYVGTGPGNLGSGGPREGPPHVRQERSDRGAHRGDELESRSMEPHGGAMGSFSAGRKTGERTFRRFEERGAQDGGESPMRMGDVGRSRFPPSGKNPFGQISASGTFRPAGKDGEAGDKRGYAARRGEAGSIEERPRGLRGNSFRGEAERSASGRDFGALRDKRRGAGANGDAPADDEEWESVPRSPETERRLRAQREADAAGDWRRGTGSPASSRTMGSRTASNMRDGAGRGDGARRTGFPSWMADDAEPSWMNDDDGAPSSAPTSATTASHSKQSGGFGAFGSLRKADAESDASTPSGMDSIQAFKAQMREKERAEKVRAGGSASSSLPAGPPPGLERRANAEESGSGSGGIFDNFSRATSAGPAAPQAQSRPAEAAPRAASEEPAASAASASAPSTGAESVSSPAQAPPGLPGRSSRFARFFDGKPRDPHAAALAAQQKHAEAHGATSPPPAAAEGLPAQAGQSVSMADLFRGLDVGGADAAPKREAVASPDSAPAPQAGGRADAPQPSSEDVASMQKIMALLNAGRSATPNGEAAKAPREAQQQHRSDSREASQHSQHSQQPQQHANEDRSAAPHAQEGHRAPSPAAAQGPPQSGASQHETGRASPALPRAHSPSSGFQQQHHQQQQAPPQQPQGQWASNASSGQQPQQHQQQGMHQGPPPPFSHPHGGDMAQQHHQRMLSSGGQQGAMSPSMGGMPGPQHFAYGGAPSRDQFGGSPIPGGPPPGSFPPGGRPPFGMDPRMLGRPPQGLPPGLPPHIAAALSGGMPPRGPGPPPPPPGMGGFVPGGAPPMFSPGGRPPPPPPGMLGALPPHVQQQLMGMPPHVQHQFLSQHFGPPPSGSPGAGPGFSSPPPPQQQAYGSPHAHQDMQPYGHVSSPSPSMSPGSQPLNAAGLMAMLGQRPSGKN